MGTSGKLKFDYLEKDDYTDRKFICDVADEGIMKSDRLKWGLVTIRHSSLSLDIKYIEYRVTNCITAVQIKCININTYFYNVQLQCLKAFMEYAIEPMEICLSCYLTGFLRSEEGVRMTCLIFGTYTKYLIVFIRVVFGNF